MKLHPIKQKKIELWQQVIDISSTIMKSAQSNHWNELHQLIESRQSLLQEYFSEPLDISPQERQDLKHDILKILNQDEIIQKISTDNKQHIGQLSKKLSLGRKMMAGYQS